MPAQVRLLAMTWRALLPLLFIFHIILTKSYASRDYVPSLGRNLAVRSYPITRPRRKILYRRGQEESDAESKEKENPFSDSFKSIDQYKLTPLHHISDSDTQEKLHANSKLSSVGLNEVWSTGSFKPSGSPQTSKFQPPQSLKPQQSPPSELQKEGSGLHDDAKKSNVESSVEKKGGVQLWRLGTIDEHAKSSSEITRAGTITPSPRGWEKRRHQSKYQTSETTPDSSGSSHGTTSGSVHAPGGGTVHFREPEQHMEYLRRKYKLKKKEMAVVRSQRTWDTRELAAQAMSSAPWHERHLPKRFKKIFRWHRG